jgi:hypothetical protein
MTPYENLSGDSGVVAYETADSFIKVQFRHSAEVYVYDGTSPGMSDVNKMKELAMAGKGLATYISQVVKKNFARIES